MKVIKNNFNVKEANKVNRLVCGHCKSELEYFKADIKYGTYGCGIIVCPLCKHENYLEDEGIELDENILEFPLHFDHHCTAEGAVNISKDRILKMVKECVEFLRKNKDEPFRYIGTGDTIVIVFRMEGDQEYEVFVTQDYYDTYLPFKSVDYIETEEYYK